MTPTSLVHTLSNRLTSSSERRNALYASLSFNNLVSSSALHVKKARTKNHKQKRCKAVPAPPMYYTLSRPPWYN